MVPNVVINVKIGWKACVGGVVVGDHEIGTTAREAIDGATDGGPPTQQAAPRADLGNQEQPRLVIELTSPIHPSIALLFPRCKKATSFRLLPTWPGLACVSLTMAAPMLEFRTRGYNPYAVKYSPYYDSRVAVASAANFGIVGNGRLFALGLTAAGIQVEKTYRPPLCIYSPV